eukprot:SAG31_NODE_47118_length_251_cov_1.335526_1_plen_39_part_10
MEYRAAVRDPKVEKAGVSTTYGPGLRPLKFAQEQLNQFS